MKTSSIKKILIAILILLFQINATAFAEFTDLNNDHKYYEAIKYLEEQNILNGYSNGEFRPEQSVNRAEFLKIVMEGSEISLNGTQDPSFYDVNPEDWYYPYVQKAKENGWILGYEDESFKPTQTIIKAEALKILGEVQNWDIKSSNENPFSDVDKNSWYASYVEYAKSSNFLYDTSNLFFPIKELNRGEISEIIYRTIKYGNGLQEIPTNTIEENTYTGETIDKNFYEEITLSNDIQKDFIENEIYEISGELNTNSDTVTIVLKNATTQESKYLYANVENNKFSKTIFFENKGTYYLGIIPNDSGTSKASEIIVRSNQLEKTTLNDKPQIEDHSIDFKNDSTFININTETNTIKKLKFTQKQTEQILYSRQNLNTITLPYEAFKDFNEGYITYELSAAKLNTNKDTITSEYSEEKTKKFKAVTHHYSINKTDSLTTNPPEKSFNIKDINFSGTFSEEIKKEAYVINEDGLVDTITLEINDNNFNFNYDVKNTGTYITEINNPEGLALLNHPIYIGNIIPLIPDYNDIRTTFLNDDYTKDLEYLQNELLDLINDTRKEYGLPSLKLDSDLSILAQYHCDNMNNFNFFSHTDQNGDTPEDRKELFNIKTIIGENLAIESSIKLAHEGLMRSASHRSNILTEQWTKVGIGITINENKQLIITQEFSLDEETQLTINEKTQEMIDLINYTRNQSSLSPLTEESNLHLAANDLNDYYISSNTIESTTFSNTLTEYEIFGSCTALAKTSSDYRIIKTNTQDDTELLNESWERLGLSLKQNTDGNYNIFILLCSL